MNTNELKILGLGLLLGIQSGAVAEIAQDLTNALNLLKSKEITVGDIYTEADIDFAWHEDFKPITQNVVRVNALSIEQKLQLPSIGTGTLVDIGIPGLKGKVVITCAHCAPDNLAGLSTLQAVNDDGDQALRGKFNVNGAITYLSVTPEYVCVPQGNALINTIENHRANLIGGKSIAVRCVYVYPNKDFCAMILENPVIFNGQIVPGIPLSDLNIIEDIWIDKTTAHVQTDSNEMPIVCGYGYTGVSGLLNGNTFGYLKDAVREGKLQERQNFSIALGWNIKKAVRLRGIDTSWGCSLSGCNCKKKQEGNERQYAYAMAGGGFSGSLVIKGKGGRPGSYNVYGIFSGPQWTEELKNFIRNAGERFLNEGQAE